MRIMYNDIWKTGTITVSSEATGYPGTNTQHIHLSRTWRPTTLSSEWIKNDLGSAKSADCIVIAGHNLSAAAVVKVQASDTDAWGAPVIDKTGNSLDSVIFIPFTLDSRRWWRVTVDDSGNPAGYIQKGRVFLCQRYESDELIDGPFSPSVEDSTAYEDSITGQRFADLGVVRKTYKFSMGTMRDATKTAIEAAFTSSRFHTPIIVDPTDNTMITVPRIYATFEKAPAFTSLGAGWTDNGLEFKEAL